MTSNMGFALGAADYFTKPIDWQRLHGVLKKYRKPAGAQTVLVVEDDDADARDAAAHVGEGRLAGDARRRTGGVGLERLDARRARADPARPDDAGDGRVRVHGRRCAARPDGRQVPVIVITAKDLTEEDRRRLNGAGGEDIAEGHDQPAKNCWRSCGR